MMSQAALSVLIALLLSLAVAGWGAETPPLLHIPRLPVAPQVDGTLDDAAWQYAAAVTGLREAVTATPGALMPQAMQTTFFLGYDAENLYLGMRSPHAPGRYPLAVAERDEDEKIYVEDSVEMNLCLGTRATWSRMGQGNYRFLISPRGMLYDAWHYGSPEDQEQLWGSGATVRCRLTRDTWTLEMAVPLDALPLEGGLDGRTALLQLARRAIYPNYPLAAAFGLGTWWKWDAAPDVVFDPTAPAVQVEQFGAAGARLRVQARPDAPCRITAEMRVLAADGAPRETRTQEVACAAGEARTLDIALAATAGQTVALEVRAGETTLLRQQAPVPSAEMTEKALQSWRGLGTPVKPGTPKLPKGAPGWVRVQYLR
ncbi:MAG TPA: hypothetical protein VGM23_18205, partial [Armatimonadota bacterium]